jgi:RNA polymerase sigma-70 factor (ECF subfamily)
MEPPIRRLNLVAPPAPSPGDGDVALAQRSDDDLMLLARGGVTGAFDMLIERHRGRMLRLAYRYVGDSALAADVGQNTFVALFRALPHYRAHGKFTSFLYRLLLNQCRMARRSARAEVRALDTVSSMQALDASETLLRERRKDVEAAVENLSSKLRDVVLLRYGGELSYQEIAETLDIPLGTAKRRAFVAMAKLRDALEAE